MVDLTVTLLASLLIWVLYFGLFLLWIIDGRIKKEVALHAFVASLLAWVISEMIKSFYPTLRPFEVNGFSALVVFLPRDGSFPSAHTAAAFALSTTVWFHNRKWGWLFVLGAFVVGAARVIGNVHFPADILGGVVIGLLAAYLFEKLHPFRFISKA